MFHVELGEVTRCSWIPGCRKLIQERGNIRGEFAYRGNGGIGRRTPRRCERFKGAILKNLVVGGTGTGNSRNQTVEESIWNPKL